jgi:hypothetical protein
MTDGAVIVAVVGVGVAMLGVLVPLLLTMRFDIRELRRDVAGIDKRLVAVETLLHERTGPRPATVPAPTAVAPAQSDAPAGDPVAVSGR